MQIGLETAWPLWLLCTVPLVAWLAWRNRVAIGPRRMALAAALRCIALVLVALALAMPSVSVPTRAISVVYALDVSASVAPAFLRTAVDWIRDTNARYRPAQAGYVLFGGTSQPFADLEQARDTGLRASSGGVAGLDIGSSDIEQGIGTALLAFSPRYAKRLVLISDGNQTQGDVWRGLPRLKAERVRVFAFPAPARFAVPAWIDGVEFPQGIRQQQPVTLRLRLGATGAARAQVRVTIEGEAVAKREVPVAAGSNEASFELRFRRAGLNTVEVALAADEHEDKRLEGVWVSPRLRVLLVEGGSAPAHYLADALRGEGIEVRTVAAQQFSHGLEAALRAADAIVLSDVPASALPAQAMRRLTDFVRDAGGGLVFVSGENTFGREGFSGSEVERLLPIKFEARRKRQELDLVLLVDRSYSMRGRKLEYAKMAAQATLEQLDEQHRLAVVGFDSQPHDVVPLAPVGNRRRAEDLVSRMTSAGRTDIFNALWHARELLAASTAQTKHVILLSDGQTAPPPSADKPARKGRKANAMLQMLTEMGYGVGNIEKLIGEDAPQRPAGAAGGIEDLVARMAAENITLSTVAIGDKPNLPLMSGIAAAGKGKSYVAQEESQIPALFVTEARRLLGESLIEEPFRPVPRGRSALLTGIDFASAPQLKGQVAAKAKRFADVLLEGKQGQPLLAETRYGLGRSVAFLSDATSRWAVEWIGWPGYGKFWAQVVRSAARSPVLQEVAWHVAREGREARITLTAFNPDGTFRDSLWPRVRMQPPQGTSSVVGLRQSAPGTYTGQVRLDRHAAKPYRFELLPGAGLRADEIARIGARTLYYPQLDEYRPRSPDIAMLKELSERTGGQLVARPEAIFTPGPDMGRAALPLWPALVCAALLAFLLEIAVRRWPRVRAGSRHVAATPSR